MISVLASKSSSPGLSPGQIHCVVFLGKTLLLSQYLSPPMCISGYWLIFKAGGNPAMD